MLELRFRTLRETVDQFVVVACTRTHQGQPIGRTRLDAITEGFLQVRDAHGLTRSGIPAIMWWVDPKMEKTERGRTYQRPPDERGPALGPWFQHVERQHRNGIIEAVEAVGAAPDDTILVSDVDEIPRPSAALQLPGLLAEHTGWMVLEQRFYSTAIDLTHPHQPWLGTTATRRRFLMPQMMRDDRGNLPTIPDGGVHFSWFGTDDERAHKLDSFSHAELATWDHVEGRRLGLHSNGEELQPAPSAWQQDLPAPIMDGSFTVPASWRR